MGWNSGLAAWMCHTWFPWLKKVLPLTAAAVRTAPEPGAATALRPCWTDRAFQTTQPLETACRREEGPTRVRRRWQMENCGIFTWAAPRGMWTALLSKSKCVCLWVAGEQAVATTNFWWTTSGENSRGCKCSTICTSPQEGSGKTCPPLAHPLQQCLPMPMDFPIPRCTFPVLHLPTVPWSLEDPKLNYAGSRSPEPNLVDLFFLCSNIPKMQFYYQRTSPPFLFLEPPHRPFPTCTHTRLICLVPPSTADPHSFLFLLQKTQQEACIKPWLWRALETGTWGMLLAILLLPQRVMRQGSLVFHTHTHWCTRPSLFKVNQLTSKGLRYPSQPASMVTLSMEGQYF